MEDTPKSSKFRFLVSDRETVEAGLVVRAAYALISIRDPDKRRVRVKKTPLMKAILELAFHDSEPTPNFRLPDNIRLMSVEDASAIWNFVINLPPEVRTVVVHCEQGMSRSPAVAAALCQGTGGDPSRFHKEFQPNAYVLRLLTETVNQLRLKDQDGKGAR